MQLPLVRLLHRSGSYRDFILWTPKRTTGATHVPFVDPHGLHHIHDAARRKWDGLQRDCPLVRQ